MPHNPNLPAHRGFTDAAGAFGVLKAKIGGSADVSIADAIQAGAIIVDYGSSFLETKSAIQTPDMSKEEAFSCLEAHFAGHQGMQAFDWRALLKALLPLILQILQGL